MSLKKWIFWKKNQKIQDEQTAQKFVDLGALSVLQKVNNSPHLRSQCSEATFIQLLDYNLPAKLSLLGHLTQANHIHDGFYDGGALGENSKFKPMVELTEMEGEGFKKISLRVRCKVQ